MSSPADAGGGGGSAQHSYYKLNDLGNAERLRDLFGHQLRHTRAQGWFHYAHGRWQMDAEKEAMRLAIEAVDQARAESKKIEDLEEQKALLKFLCRSQNARPLMDTLRLAAALQPIAAVPGDFDIHHHLLNVANGVISLQTGAISLDDEKLMLTQQTPISYTAEAMCPRWEQFLKEVFAGDQEVIDFVQRAVGYSLTGDVREETLFFFSGDGSNGKSTFLETIQFILGDYACPAPRTLIAMTRGDQHPTEIAKLVGKRFVVVSETRDGVRLDEEKVKVLASTDPISARLMRQDFFEFLPTHKLWLTSNCRPMVRGTDKGIWRRVPLIPFEVTFRDPGEGLPGELVKDLGLKDHLREHEAAGILAWAVRGAVSWYENGLGIPASVLEASKEYREDMDWMAQFLGECCRMEEGTSAQSSAVYLAYQDWCKRNGEQPRSHMAFSGFLSKRGLIKKRTERCIMWLGLAVRPESEILGDRPTRL